MAFAKLKAIFSICVMNPFFSEMAVMQISKKLTRFKPYFLIITTNERKYLLELINHGDFSVISIDSN